MFATRGFPFVSSILLKVFLLLKFPILCFITLLMHFIQSFPLFFLHIDFFRHARVFVSCMLTVSHKECCFSLVTWNIVSFCACLVACGFFPVVVHLLFTNIKVFFALFVVFITWVFVSCMFTMSHKECCFILVTWNIVSFCACLVAYGFFSFCCSQTSTFFALFVVFPHTSFCFMHAYFVSQGMLFHFGELEYCFILCMFGCLWIFFLLLFININVFCFVCGNFVSFLFCFWPCCCSVFDRRIYKVSYNDHAWNVF